MHLLLRSFQASKRDNILGFHFYEQSDSNPGLPNLQITRRPLRFTSLSRIIFKKLRFLKNDKKGNRGCAQKELLSFKAEDSKVDENGF